MAWRPRSLAAERQDQLADRPRIAVGEPSVLAVEELEGVLDAEFLELRGERLGAEVEEVLVALSGIEVDAAHRAQGIGMAGRHPNWIELEPACPDVVDELPGRDLEGQQGLAGSRGIR